MVKKYHLLFMAILYGPIKLLTKKQEHSSAPELFTLFACQDGFDFSSAHKINTKSLQTWKRGRIQTTCEVILFGFEL